MSVLLVTDEDDDDIQIPKYEYLYQQIKELEYNFSSIETSLSTVLNSKSHHHHHRRRYRPQQCLVKHLLTYMLTLLFLTNHLHWSIIFFSLSSIKFMSTYATTTTLTSSIIKEDEQQCSLTNGSYIDRICSKTCRIQKTPFEKLENINQLLLDSHYSPFCSNYTLDQSINQTNFSYDEITEDECRHIFTQLITFDEEARKASALFATYMQSIDSASEENRYSIIHADCQEAYRTWACSINIPYFHRNQLISPCQTICDEVERVCPTFRPSDREPLFAGQPLFFCHGGIVTNSDYGQRPHCFDTCHLADGSFQHHSVSSSSSDKSLSTKLTKDRGTTLSCFEIELLSPSSSEQLSLPLSTDDSMFNHTSNTSISASAISIISSTWSSIIVNIFTFIFVLQLRILQE